MKDHAPHASKIQISIILLVCLFSLFPITNSIIQSHAVHGALPAAQVTFIPEITPMPGAIISASTPISTVSAVYPSYEEWNRLIESTALGSVEYGYEQIWKNGLLTYRIWSGNEEIVFQPDNFIEESAVRSFIEHMGKLDLYTMLHAKEIETHQNAVDDATRLSFVVATGGTVALTTCIGVPLTLGATGVACIGGALTTIVAGLDLIAKTDDIKSAKDNLQHQLEQYDIALSKLQEAFQVLDSILDEQNEEEEEL